MEASDWIARFLAAQGVEAVYEVAGGMIANILDALHRDGRIRIVSCHHEQAAGFAAEGHARMTGVPAVALATSGPGALNLLTALGSCHFDSTPAVFITGQVNRSEQKRDLAVRQLGFQETDIASMAAPITKAAWRIESLAELPKRLSDAFALASAGRPGPVLVDIPFDLQRLEMDAPVQAAARESSEDKLDSGGVAAVIEDLARARRPMILAGGGLRAARAVPAFRELVDRLGVPVVNSLMGVDVLAYGHPLRVGLIGTYGNRWANMALARSDALLVLGSRLDIRQTGADTEAFAAGRIIHHLDVDPAEVNNRVRGCIPLLAGLGAGIGALAAALGTATQPDRGEWLAEIAELERDWPDVAELEDIDGINPNWLMHQFSEASEVEAYVADVGQHQMWAAQSLEVGERQRFITSGGMGAMGSGLPLAVGACLAGGGPVVLIAGDGGFQLNIQELQTVVRNELALKMVILNNGCHGMVRQFQDSYFEGRYQSTLWGYSAPSFTDVARAYGIAAGRAEVPEDLPGTLRELWSTPGPYLLEVAIDQAANAYPKIAFGHPISEMEPFAAPKALEPT
jgi:acetolactate synthase-1/2/3 large subunit